MRISGFLLVLTLSFSSLYGEGKMIINPITDVCWKCVFPLKIAGKKVAKGGENSFESASAKKGLCHCPAEKLGLPTLVGIPISFWEPTRVIEITRNPGKLVALGGMKLPVMKNSKKGAVSSSGRGSQTASYYVHCYEYPIFNLLNLGTSLVCTEFEKKSFFVRIPYLSELDPEWHNEKLSKYLNPESLLFANPLAQVSCAPDCIASTIQKPNDLLFWCAGCQGSLFPLTGFVANHIGGLQSSLLLMQRVIAKLHQRGGLKTYSEGDPLTKKSYCQKGYSRRVKRSQYKTQLVYPVSMTKGPCQALGKTELFWGAGKSFPVKGEEFCYILWTERRCCLDPIKAGFKKGFGI